MKNDNNCVEYELSEKDGNLINVSNANENEEIYVFSIL